VSHGQTAQDTDRQFREELLGWLSSTPHDAVPAVGQDQEFEQRREWQRRLAGGGWAAVGWPAQYGGRDASATQSAIFFEEIARIGAPLPANVLGLLLAGPTILHWGTAEQKERYLPPIISADEIWCQGFSEPDSGSDLASVSTRATPTPGGWIVSGQKVWTSYAKYADRCMLLARTDPGATRHAGLSYFLLDMSQPQVRVRPLRDITGAAHFNEVFIDEAFVSADDVLGDVGNGWRVAMTTLNNERSGLSFFHQVRMRQFLDRLVREADVRGLLADVRIGDSLADVLARVEALRLTADRGLTTLERTGAPGPENSVTKLLWATTNQQLTQLAVDILGADAVTEGSSWSHELLRARGNSIEGGTNEILKNIVAERVLSLPRAR